MNTSNVESSPAYQYVQSLVSGLSADVTEAEKERQVSHHTQVQNYFYRWNERVNGNQPLLDKVLSIKKSLSSRHNLTPEEDLIKSGLAGLGRIGHVDANSEFKKTEDSARLNTRMAQSLDLYEKLDPENLVPWTIHGGSIYWPAEIAQDIASSQILLGHPNEAELTLQKAIIDSFKITLEIGKIDFNTPDEILKAENYSAFKARKRAMGATSALGVLWYRKAMISKDLTEMEKAISFTTLAQIRETNPHRLAIIALKTLQSSLSPNFFGDLRARTFCFAYGFSGVFEAFCYSPNDTMASINQALRERK